MRTCHNNPLTVSNTKSLNYICGNFIFESLNLHRETFTLEKIVPQGLIRNTGGVCFWIYGWMDGFCFIFLEILSQMKENEVVIFTDGSALGNLGPTGPDAVVYLTGYQSSPILLKKGVSPLSNNYTG